MGKYDYLIVGIGLYGITFAQIAYKLAEWSHLLRQ